MNVSVLYFGVLKDLQGRPSRAVELPDHSTVATLLEAITTVDSPAWACLAVAVNRVYAGRETLLRDGDEVALLPPVSGGVA